MYQCAKPAVLVHMIGNGLQGVILLNYVHVPLLLLRSCFSAIYSPEFLANYCAVRGLDRVSGCARLGSVEICVFAGLLRPSGFIQLLHHASQLLKSRIQLVWCCKCLLQSLPVGSDEFQELLV